MFGFLFAQEAKLDPIDIQDKLNEMAQRHQELQMELAINPVFIEMQNIEYSFKLLNDMLKPPKEEEIDEKDTN